MILCPKELLLEIRSLCNLIVNSSPDTKIKGEIEERAFWIAHHNIILNLNSKEEITK